MALSHPYTLDFLAKCLLGDRIPLELRRFDEMSGSGDGRFWGAQMATPLWGASYALTAHDAAHAREINAKIYALDGVSKPFLWADPYYKGPASGVTAGLDNVTIGGISPERGSISLENLPAGFVLSAGDYISIRHSNGRIYFGQFAEGGRASETGFLGGRELRPYLPFGVGPGSPVVLVQPRFRAIVAEYTPFASFKGRWGDSAAITILQKP